MALRLSFSVPEGMRGILGQLKPPPGSGAAKAGGLLWFAI